MLKNIQSFRIDIVFDNRSIKNEFLEGFGFSALIYNYFTGNFLLFDTGGNSEILIHNFKSLNIDIKEIKKIIISHDHFDHSGGLEGIYNINSEIEIYIPFETYTNYKSKFPNSKINKISNSIVIEKNVYSSGQLGTSLKEQAIYLKTLKNEIIILVGCAHPGLENIIVDANKFGNIKAIIGGFHNFRKYSYLKNIQFIGACHCTTHINDIKKRFPNQYKEIFVGSSLIF